MKVKLKAKIRPNLRLYFIICVFVILCLTVAVSGGITFVLNLLVSATIAIPAFIWILIFSVVLGTSMTALLSRWILSPITRLSDAINRVATGDFTVSLRSDSRIMEIRNTYRSFNRMVRGLRATETLQSDFVSNVSHEFKTPINAIEGYAMLLQDKNQTPEERQKCIDRMLFNTNRLSGLVGDLLLLSSVENSSGHIERQTYRLDEQVRQALLSLEQKWVKKQIEFDVDMEQVLYDGNESLMLHVWSNLIDNAIKFDPYGGLVKIRLKEAPGRIEFTIQDNGPGISDAARKHIFDRFYQGDTSHRSEGNGLGLALVKKILDVCGWEIQIQSGPDCGSTFTLTTPLAKEKVP